MDFTAAFAQARARAETYGLTIEIGDVTDPNTGDLDGQRIVVDFAEPDETRLFLLAHLFGHCVQWNCSAESRAIGQAVEPPRTPAEFALVEAYERDASRYGLQLLREAGVAGLERWITDQCAADWRFLEHFYRTGNRTGAPAMAPPDAPLEPLPIPPFTPRRFQSRFAI